MPSYENMMITVTMLLFFINAFFVFSWYLPANQYDMNSHLQLGLSDSQISDMNARLNGVIDTNVFNGGTQDLNTALSASSSPKTYLTLFQNWLFSTLNTATLGISGQIISSVSLVGTLISVFGSMFFGYMVWIDLFLSPAIPATAVLGTAIKIFLFIVQVLGIFDIIFRIFWVGTGVRG